MYCMYIHTNMYKQFNNIKVTIKLRHRGDNRGKETKLKTHVWNLLQGFDCKWKRNCRYAISINFCFAFARLFIPLKLQLGLAFIYCIWEKEERMRESYSYARIGMDYRRFRKTVKNSRRIDFARQYTFRTTVFS